MLPDPSSQTSHVCADCGATEGLYFDELAREWACEEVADCILDQKDAAVAEANRLRQALRTIEQWATHGYQDLPPGGVLSCVRKEASKALEDSDAS